MNPLQKQYNTIKGIIMKKIASLFTLSFLCFSTLFGAESKFEDTIPLPGGSFVTNKLGPVLIISKYKGPHGTATVVHTAKPSVHFCSPEKGDLVAVGFISTQSEVIEGRLGNRRSSTSSPFDFVTTGRKPHKEEHHRSSRPCSAGNHLRGKSSSALPLERPQSSKGCFKRSESDLESLGQ